MDNYLSEYISLVGGKKKSSNQLRRKTSSYKPKRADYTRPRSLESYEDYQNKIIPSINKNNTQWVFDIFSGKREQNRIIYQDNDFVLIPDIKWDGRNMIDLHVLAFFKDPRLQSIRDLTKEDIKLLDRVMKISLENITKKYNLIENQLKIYFHYKPSVWQLHLHFENLFHKTGASSVERAYSIYSVLENLKLNSDYFKKVKLHVFNSY
jgi:m7GpppX diphosphatase